jgi:hypothetical protein
MNSVTSLDGMVVGVVGWMETLFINIVHVHSLTIRKNTNNEWKKIYAIPKPI